MKLIIKFIFCLLIFYVQTAYSQTCPTYLKRNNGNNQPENCGSFAGIPTVGTWQKQGSFEFTGVSATLSIDKVETYNSGTSSWEIFQDNTVTPRVYNSNIWFGAYSGDPDRWVCFYSPNGTQSPPAANWRFTFMPTAGSTFTCSYNINSSGTLPVTWETVSAEKQNGQSVLRWSTASEQNTKDFVVQHSLNTTDWSALSTIPAAGNSTTTRNYSYVHQNPLKGINYNYYRILQRDLDDKFSYSKIVSIVFNEPGADLQVYPNPAEDVVTVFISEEQEVSLLNAAGALVWKSKLPAGRTQLPLVKFSSGLYFLKTKTQTIKLLIK